MSCESPPAASGEVALIALVEDAIVTEMKINAHDFPAQAVAFCRDAKKLATGSALESVVWLWEKLPE